MDSSGWFSLIVSTSPVWRLSQADPPVVAVFSACSPTHWPVMLHSSCSCSRVLANSDIHPQLLTLQHLLSDWEDRQCVKAVQPGSSFPGFPTSCSKDRKSLNSPSVSALVLTSFGCCKAFVLSLQPPPSLLYSWKRLGSQGGCGFLLPVPLSHGGRAKAQGQVALPSHPFPWVAAQSKPPS